MLRGIDFVKDLRNKPSVYLKQIYVDTSGDKTASNFIASLELFGPEHIVWGSDYPAKKDIAASMDVLDRLSLAEIDKKNILGGNIEKIFKQVKL